MGRKPMTYIARQLSDKSYISKYKVTKLSDQDIYEIESKWLDRITTLDTKTGQLLSSDSRLFKASTLISSAALSDKYKIRIISKESTPIEDIITSLKYIYNREDLANDILTLMEEEKFNSYILENLINMISDKKIKSLLLEAKVTLDKELYYKDLLNIFIRKIDLNRIMFDGIFNAVKLGDSFYEIVYDSSSILSIEPLMLEKVYPSISNKGIVERWLYYSTEYIDPVALYPHQVLHFTFLPDEYIGSGLFSKTMNVSAITRQIENFMMLSRKTRSVQTRFHFPSFNNLPESVKEQAVMPTEAELHAYRQSILRAITNNSGASLDIFSNGKWDVKNIPSDGTNFNYVDDVEYFNDLFQIGLLVPPGLIGNGESVNRATMDVQIKFLKGLFNVLKQERINNTEQLVTMELILKNIDPDSFYVEVTNDNTGLVDILEASQIVSRLNNKYNNFPMPVLSNILGIDWKDVVDGYKLQDLAGIQPVEK